MPAAGKFAIAVHGGADSPHPGEGPPGTAAERRAALLAALERGRAVLEAGGAAVEAAIGAVTALEDCPLFNAGRGSAFAADGGIEMDASAMDGASGRAGGVTTVRTVRNPILAARAVMAESAQALLCAAGAEAFAAAHGLAMKENAWFATAHRRAQLDRARARTAAAPGASPKTGTVGCVARDRAGNLAAATSTGGYTNKPPGRVSDSAVIGAGTWAENGVCAISCTGTGDLFIRDATARAIAALVQYGGMDLAAASGEALGRIAANGGFGGVIGIDAAGRIVAERRAERMAWASLVEGEEPAAEG
ncbi:MAG: isoaspartyl peptidase/L-asparaginase [Alphaproteobacteria bacterium]|nr:isoaspartyl peptidase/L-asparaginase [Alphaproteobacteria bacterium]